MGRGAVSTVADEDIQDRDATGQTEEGRWHSEGICEVAWPGKARDR